MSMYHIKHSVRFYPFKPAWVCVDRCERSGKFPGDCKSMLEVLLRSTLLQDINIWLEFIFGFLVFSVRLQHFCVLLHSFHRRVKVSTRNSRLN